MLNSKAHIHLYNLESIAMNQKLMIALFCSLSFALQGLSQSGVDCQNAIPLSVSSPCALNSYTTTIDEMWFSFNATNEFVSINLKTTQYGVNAPHIDEIGLYENSCGNLSLVSSDELPFVYDTNNLAIQIDAANIVVGNTYYVVAKRKPSYTAPTTFKMCVEEVNVLIPDDINSEPAARAHAFIRHKGQIVDTDGVVVPEILYHTFTVSPDMYVMDGKMAMTWSEIDDDTTTIDTLHRIDMTFVNALPDVKTLQTEERKEITNYFLPQAPLGITNVKSFDRVIQQSIYRQIDVHYYSSEEGLKLYFVVNPGGDPSQVYVNFDGASSVNINTNGELEIASVFDVVQFEKPIFYQLTNGNNGIVPLNGGSYIQSNGGFRLNTPNYDNTKPLVIMIQRKQKFSERGGAENPVWGTYFGGTQDDKAHDLDSDPNGNLYMVGETKSTTANGFPIDGPGQIFQSVQGGDFDGFLAKFDPDYTLIWSTYIGGSGDDVGLGVSYTGNAGGQVFISGYSSSDQATLPSISLGGSSFNGTSSSGHHGLLGRFNPNTGLPDWISTFGGNNAECRKIKADSNGNLYVVGDVGDFTTTTTCNSYNNGIPLCNSTGTSYQAGFVGGNPLSLFQDAFFAKFNPNMELVWSTFFGGDRDEEANDVAIDEVNNRIYFVGWTDSDDDAANNCNSFAGSFPTCDPGGAFFDDNLNSNNLGTDPDGFIAQFDLDGHLEWCTYLGGTREDYGSSCAVSPDGELYVITYSNTFSNNNINCGVPTGGGFPTCDQGSVYFQSFGNAGFFDQTITRFDDNRNLRWSTFYGGSLSEGADVAFFPQGLVEVNPATGDVFLGGHTDSGSNSNPADLPTATNGSYYDQGGHGDNTVGGFNSDGYLTSFDSNGALQWGTYFGGAGANSLTNGDIVEGVAFVQQNVFMCGWTHSTTLFPYQCPGTANPWCQNSTTVSTTKADAFIAQMNQGPVGIEERSQQKASLHIFPNPTSDYINIAFNSGENGSGLFAVYDLAGREISTGKVGVVNGENRLSIDLTTAEAGTYLVKISINNELYTGKIIKTAN